jgi:rhamnulose-1-phosphate aldolase/alcohol dehydrogenase
MRHELLNAVPLVYRSNLLGADLRLTNYGGGNTSCKIMEADPLTGDPVPVMWIKGSGGDLGTLTRKGLSALYVDRLRALEKKYRGLSFEDEMVDLFSHCLFDPASKAPSIDTPLHGFLPYAHIDHLHPDAVIAIAAAKDGKAIAQELFQGKIGWVDWQRPGFDLGLKLRSCITENKELRGIILGSHGLFTWGDTAYACYCNTLEVVEQSAAYLAASYRKKRKVFGGALITAPAPEKRHQQAAALMPVLRGLLCAPENATANSSSGSTKVGHFADDDTILEFVNSADLQRLAPLGTSCPDHFLRTKIAPWVLPLTAEEDLSDRTVVQNKLKSSLQEYKGQYQHYYREYCTPDSPPIRDANPVVLLYPGIGLFTFAKDKSTARIAAEFYCNAIQVMKGAEAISAYTALPRNEAFRIEYWLLEEAKLQRMPPPKPLSGKVVLVTGSGGGIGKAIARKMAAEGACVVLSDIHPERLQQTLSAFQQEFGKDVVRAVPLNVTDASSIQKAFQQMVVQFGGIDVLVNNAGISISKTLLEHTESDWDQLYAILAKGQFLVTQQAVALFRQQGMGGDIVNIVSKNALAAGPNNTAYGSAKAAQLHLSRLLAAELGPDHIRVNVINPDAVIADSNIWAGGWAEGRAKAYGITVEELPAYYARRTLLNEIIYPEDIAKACFVLVGGALSKSTGNMLNVDGGLPQSFPR